MDPWFAKAAVLMATAAIIAIRAPHGQRSRRIPVVQSRRGALETILLTIAWIAFMLPLVWVATPLLEAADYPLHPAPFAVGMLCIVLGLWLFHRAHADLGTNWSITLELRAQHRLVTQGIYRRVRHPMYLALLICSAGQALVVPNWIAGPSYCLAMVLITACRIGPEERMMREAFEADYEEYVQGSKRLLPGIW